MAEVKPAVEPGFGQELVRSAAAAVLVRAPVESQAELVLMQGP